MARKLVGQVVSDVQDKTIVVAISRSVTHPLYGKRYNVTKKFAVHDEKNAAHIGDKVEIVETRPISKRKTFTLAKIVETGHAEVEVKGEELIADVEKQRREARDIEAEEVEVKPTPAKPAKKAKSKE
jgi:small subunit ribosomal protein S17